MNLLDPSILHTLATAASGALAALGLNGLFKRQPLPAEALQTLTELADKIVLAVEQKHADLAGDARKQLAVQLVGTALSAMGLKIPAPLIDAAIEEAVAVMNRAGKPAGQQAAASPKSPAVTYTYDMDGNLIHKEEGP